MNRKLYLIIDLSTSNLALKNIEALKHA